MGEIELLREEINRLDAEMAALFEQRMQVSKKIGLYKKARGLPIKDKEREGVLIAKCQELISEQELKPYYVDFQNHVIQISCNLQEKLTSKMKVAYSGVPGAFAYIAAKRLFPEAELIAFSNFEPAYRAAEKGEVDCAVLPMENSYAGEVGAVTDLMFSGHLYVNKVYKLEIEHQLLGVPGADLKKVRKVVSHPQALEQCDQYIKEHGFETEEYSNTARAAQHVKELNDPSVAAIASDETAGLMGLEIIDSNIHSMKNNSSRFAVFSRVQHLPAADAKNDSCSFILMYTVPDEAGALAMTLDLIGSHGFNMRSLKSRPMKDLLWSYYFYVEANGNISSEEGREMLQELSAICGQLKLAGTYSDMN